MPTAWASDSIDVTDQDSVGAALDAVIARFGRTDGLMHTVGGYRAGTPIHETLVEDWDFLINLNARSVFVTNRAVIPLFREAHAAVGRLVARCERDGKRFADLTLEQFREAHEAFDADVLEIDLDAALAARSAPGGTAPQTVALLSTERAARVYG